MTDSQAFVTIVAVAAATMLTRFLSFAVFSDRKKTPAFILYLGIVLPYSVIGLLIVYCFKDVSLFTRPYGLPEAAAAALTAVCFCGGKTS